MGVQGPRALSEHQCLTIHWGFYKECQTFLLIWTSDAVSSEAEDTSALTSSSDNDEQPSKLHVLKHLLKDAFKTSARKNFSFIYK